jgi:hypothetical protein
MDINAIKQRLNSLQSSGAKKEKVDYSKYYWKPKQEGKYQIRIVPSALNKENPFQEVFVHYGFSKFPIYALTNWSEKDPIVEFAKQLRGTSEKENWQLAKKLDPKMRVFAPVVVRGEEDKGVRLWEFGKEIYMQLLGIAEDEDYGDFTDINDGRDFTVEAVMGDIGGRQGIKCSIRVKPKTSPLGTDKTQLKSWLSEQPNVLELQKKMTFEDLKSVLEKFLNPEAETEEEEEVVVPAKVTNAAPKDLPWEDDEDEEDEAPAPNAKLKEAKANYDLKINSSKTSKAAKFDALFEDEE